MKIIREKDYADMSRKAANIISAQVLMKPNCVLGLATGGTPVGAYAQLVDLYNTVSYTHLDVYKRQTRSCSRSAHGRGCKKSCSIPRPSCSPTAMRLSLIHI